MDGNSGYSQPSGYGQGGFGQQQASGYGQSAGWNLHSTGGASSPAYGTEFAHTHTHDADPFVAASSQVAIDIETISLNYREIRDASHEINTPKDTVEFRQALRKKIEDSSALGKKIQAAIRALASVQHGNVQERRANKAKVDKMDASFTSFYSQQFLACVRTAEEQMRRYTPRTASATPSGPPMNDRPGMGGQYYAMQQDEHDERAGLIEAERQQQYAQLSSDVDAQNAQIAYRDQAIRSLQRDMSEVHDMFKDLANLVSEQGHMVDDIESNVTAAENDVVVGLGEVNKAHDYQKKGRNKLCIAAIIISILAAIAVLIVVVVVMTRPKK